MENGLILTFIMVLNLIEGLIKYKIYSIHQPEKSNPIPTIEMVASFAIFVERFGDFVVKI